MNILHISRTMGQGGAEKVVYQISKEKPDNIKMYIASTGGTLVRKLNQNNVEHIVIPDIDKKNIVLIVKTLLILFKTIKKYDIHIIHAHHRMAAFYSRLIGIFNHNIKRVYTAHNVFFNRKKLLRFSLKGSQIVAVGNGVKENLQNVYGIEENRIQVIYNSVEKPIDLTPVKDEFILNKGSKVFVGIVGRLSEQKGIDVFIKAMSKVISKNSDVYGIIIGDGELKNEMIELTNSLNNKEHFMFLGYRSDVLSLISNMDFIVLPSRWEGFPLTPIETFMMKKTIIATNIDGNNEIICDGYNGLLFEKENYSELENKIEMLLCKKLKEELEKNAYDDYINKYRYEEFIDSYYNLYRMLDTK